MAEDLRKVKTFSLFGAGKLGCNLVYSLINSGYELKYIYKKSRFNCFKNLIENDIHRIVEDSDIIFISTGESVVSDLSADISKNGKVSGKYFFHTSNSLTSDELIKIEENGGFTASLSPLQTFVDFKKDPAVFKDVFFLTEGSSTAVSLAEQIVSDLKGKLIKVNKSEKIYYHIAAVISSNFMISLLKFSRNQLNNVHGNGGVEIFFPLLRETLSNIEERGLSKSLSGPVERGEKEIVERHLKKLKGKEKELYLLLSEIISEDI